MKGEILPFFIPFQAFSCSKRGEAQFDATVSSTPSHIFLTEREQALGQEPSTGPVFSKNFFPFSTELIVKIITIYG